MRWQVCDLVDRLAGERRTGLIFVDEHGHRRDYTFAEIVAYSARYAAVLRAFGVQAGERVYVHLSGTGKCIFTLLALERLGAHAVLEETDAAGASAIISNRKYRGEIDAARERFASEARYMLIGEECEGWARLDTLAQIASPMEIAGRELGDPPAHLEAVASDVVWCALQIEERDWLRQAVAQAWACGAAAVVHNGAFDPRERLDLVRELDVTILLQRADDYHAELALPDSTQFKMPRLRRCMGLGSGFDDVLKTQWEHRFGVPLTPDGAPWQQTA